MTLSRQYEIGETMTDEDSLAHYGVKGMKWGKRKKVTSGEIMDARTRLLSKQLDYDAAKRKVKAQTDPGKKAAGQKRLDKMKVNFLNNPDRVTATRMTTGEMVIRGLLTTPVGLAGAVAGSQAVSRRIQYKQETGAYNKK